MPRLIRSFSLVQYGKTVGNQETDAQNDEDKHTVIPCFDTAAAETTDDSFQDSHDLRLSVESAHEHDVETGPQGSLERGRLFSRAPVMKELPSEKELARVKELANAKELARAKEFAHGIPKFAERTLASLEAAALKGSFSGLTLEMEQGRMIAIVGPPSQGKGTILRLLSGQIFPNETSFGIAGTNSLLFVPPHLRVVQMQENPIVLGPEESLFDNLVHFLDT